MKKTDELEFFSSKNDGIAAMMLLLYDGQSKMQRCRSFYLESQEIKLNIVSLKRSIVVQ